MRDVTALVNWNQSVFCHISMNQACQEKIGRMKERRRPDIETF